MKSICTLSSFREVLLYSFHSVSLCLFSTPVLWSATLCCSLTWKREVGCNWSTLLKEASPTHVKLDSAYCTVHQAEECLCKREGRRLEEAGVTSRKRRMSLIVRNPKQVSPRSRIFAFTADPNLLVRSIYLYTHEISLFMM